MPVAATGPISLPLARLKTLLSESTNFQTLAGVGSAAAALAFIDLVRKASPDVTTGHALIGQVPGGGGGLRFARIKQGSSASDPVEGRVRLTLRKAVTQSDAADAEFEFTNSLGAIVEDLIDNSGRPANLQITAIALVDLSRSDPDQEQSQGKIYKGDLDVIWSGRVA
jgi:hypothetical protein